MSDKFLYMSDAHIKARTWTNNMQLTGDAYAALNRLTRYVLCNQIDTLVIGGDWFDSNRPSSEDVNRSASFFQCFRHVYYILGNHDNVRPPYLEAYDSIGPLNTDMRWLSYHGDKTPLFFSPLLDGTSVVLAGVDWINNADELKAAVTAVVDAAKVMSCATLYLVLHTSFKHLLAFDGAYKLDADFIRPLADGINLRVLVGDIHTRNTMDIVDTSYIHSAGSLYPLSADKMDTPCCASVIDTVTGEITDVPTDVRCYYRFDWTNIEEFRQLVATAIAENGEDYLPPLIRVVVPADVQDVHLLDSDYPGVVIQVLSSASESIESSQIVKSASSGYSIEQAIKDEAEACAEDPDIAELAIALTTADDPTAMLESWLTDWEVERVR